MPFAEGGLRVFGTATVDPARKIRNLYGCHERINKRQYRNNAAIRLASRFSRRAIPTFSTRTACPRAARGRGDP
jgi:hypothetical protein